MLLIRVLFFFFSFVHVAERMTRVVIRMRGIARSSPSNSRVEHHALFWRTTIRLHLCYKTAGQATFSSVLGIMLDCDVIAIICAEVSSRRDLLSLGLASKKFLGPALDILWKNMSSIKPLLSVLTETTLVNGQKACVD